MTPLLVLDASWASIETALSTIAESGSKRPGEADLERLRGLGLAEPDEPPRLTPSGERYWTAKFVLEDADASGDALADILKANPVAAAFCAALWGAGDRPVTGALRLVRQLTKSSDDVANRRWLALMNSAGLIVYNRKYPTLKVVYNPNELAPAAVAEKRELTAGHVLSPERPYANLMALRSVLRSASDFLWWYDPHMPAKVLETLYAELDGAKVKTVRILSGPANVTPQAKAEFESFKKEMKSQRGIEAEWRVLDKAEQFKRHDRILLSKDQAKNMPPFNTILAGSVGEILPSEIKPSDFTEWWKVGTNLAAFVIPPAAAS